MLTYKKQEYLDINTIEGASKFIDSMGLEGRRDYIVCSMNKNPDQFMMVDLTSESMDKIFYNKYELYSKDDDLLEGMVRSAEMGHSRLWMITKGCEEECVEELS